VAVAAAIGISGCGGSSSTDRTKYSKEITAQLKGSSLPADLGTCVGQRANTLPIDQEKALASGGSNASSATKKVAIGLVTDCIKQGKGLSVLHQLIVQSIKSSASSSLPPAFTQCVIAKANQTSASQLSQLISSYANENQATAQAQAKQVGVGLGRACLTDPSIVNALRGVFVAPIKQAFAGTKYSAAFKNCVLKKAEHYPTAKLQQAALNPSGANAQGEAFGKAAAKACIASGAKP
jgi:hypothetical protein